MSAITRHSDIFFPEKRWKIFNIPFKKVFSTTQKRQNCSYRWDASRESKNEFLIVFVRCFLGWKKYRFL